MLTEKITSAVSDALKILRTRDLIDMLAAADEDWAQADLDRAAEETDASPFSLADVALARFYLSDEYIQDAQRSLDYLTRSLLAQAPEDRPAYYRRNILPLVQGLSSYRRGIRSQFAGLVFYAEP